MAARRALRGCRLWGASASGEDGGGAAPQGGASTSWGGATAVELGAGLGLPSIVAHSLGMKVVATLTLTLTLNLTLPLTLTLTLTLTLVLTP